MDFGQPRRGGEDADAEFFFKLALQGLEVGFARFDLAAGKFPISGIGFTFGTGTEQVVAVSVEQDAGNDADKGAGVLGHGVGEKGRLKIRKGRICESDLPMGVVLFFGNDKCQHGVFFVAHTEADAADALFFQPFG